MSFDRLTPAKWGVPDRAGQFTASFDSVLADAGIEAVKIRPGTRTRTLMRKG